MMKAIYPILGKNVSDILEGVTSKDLALRNLDSAVFISLTMPRKQM